jgi:acid phosphatase type 7
MRKTSVIIVALTAACLCASPAAAQDPVIAAAGDNACDPDDPNMNGGAGTDAGCRQRATSDLLVGAPLAAVLPLGDIQYNSASLSNILAVYDPTWGRVKAISRPILGNHESTGNGYFDYFNGPGAMDGPAGPRGKGYYSFDVGTWHLVALNSNCARVSCSAGSEQEQWLRADLAAHPTNCTLAYWHHPRYSSGHEGNQTSMQALWEALDDADAEILLSGHSHDYERVAPVDRNGGLDPANGIRQFVVGTGGAFFTGGLDTLIPQSEVAQNHTFGVLFLALHPTSYDWRFVPEAGKTFTDSGSTACHNSSGPVPPPPPPPPPPPADATPPVISNLTASPRRFSATPPAEARADATPPVISNLTALPERFWAARKSSASRKRWTTFGYELSEAATVRVTISRRFRGRRVGGRCRRVRGTRRGAPRCVGFRKVGGFSQQGAAGPNSRRFRGRLGNRRLSPGKFRASFVATDAAVNRSGRKSVTFAIVRARRR